jgi:formate hydrogenlyase subunit 4
MNRVEIASGILNLIIVMVLAPLPLGVVNRIKAKMAGRKGPPLLQLYYDLIKLLRKGAVFSHTTTPLFYVGPIIALMAIIIALLFLPYGKQVSPFGFSGDLVFFIYLLALARIFTVIAAMDTGSAFEGMGSSRELGFAVLVEVAVVICLAAIAKTTHSFKLSEMMSVVSFSQWQHNSEVLFLMLAALFVALLVENCRIPFDDPNTHLELTMIHEVMILDHSGPDLAVLLYTAALKFWLFATLCAQILVPVSTGSLWIDQLLIYAAVLVVAVLVGITESVTARLRLVKVPEMLLIACALSILAFLAVMR